MAYIKRYSPEVTAAKLVHAAPGIAAALGAEFGPHADIGAGLLRWVHVKYDFAVDGGAISTITLVSNYTLPANAVLFTALAIINSTTAVTSAGSATISIGTSAGSSASAILAATGKASFSGNALVVGATGPVKLSAAGAITFTVATAALTAGVIEAFIPFVVMSA